MKSRNRRWLKATIAAVGAGALALGGAALPAVATEPTTEPSPLQIESDKYELAAQRVAPTADELQRAEAQGELVVTENGFVISVDDALTGTAPAQVRTHSFDVQSVPGSPAEGSRPGAPVTIYLDFDGETLEGTVWNDEQGEESLTFEPAADLQDAAFQEEVWAAVVEDYAPFNVNVTTVRPSDDALYKTSEGDNEYGVHVIVTDSYSDVLDMAEGTGGLAILGAAGSDYATGAFVFTEGLGGYATDAATIATVASHESGHNFGLEHHGHGDDEYYSPTEGLWGPLMGAPYDVPVTQWSDGSYAGASNPAQNDLEVIADRSAAAALLVALTYPDGTPYPPNTPVCSDGDPNNPQPGDRFFEPNAQGTCEGDLVELEATWTYTDRADFASDDHGDTEADATELDNDNTSFEATGVVEQTADVDVFALTTAGGTVEAGVEVAEVGPNLNAQLILADEDGNVLAQDEGAPEVVGGQAVGLGAEVSATDVEAGVYYLFVTGVGFGDPSNATGTDAGGFSAYGSLGHYTLSGTAEPIEADPIVITSPEDGAEVEVGDLEVTGTATPDATVTVTANGEAVTAEVDADGNWAATVEADYGNTEIVATQQLDAIDLPGSDSVTVTAPVPAPEIAQPEDGSSTEDTTPTVSGTGIPGATVSVSVTGTSGDQITAEAEVDAEGNWEVELSELGEGTYVITANQTINGVTSENSESVTITVTVQDDDGNGGGGGGEDDNGGTLPETGSDFGFAPFALLALLLMGAGAAGITLHNRKTMES